jgi:peptidoglycan/LPS O-acetylase OafA/YrhL
LIDKALLTSEREAPAVAAGPRRWRPDIQGLRALAVLLVVLYHAGVPGITGGYAGVDVFFVISGFLITSQLVRAHERTGRVGFGAFYAGRIRRLLPSAAVVIVATTILGALVLSPFEVRSLLKDALAATFYVINYRFAFQGTVYQEFASAPSALQHLWSLAVEEQFYIIWPALIALCALAGRRRFRGVLAVTLAVGGAISLGLSIAMTPGDPSMAYFSLQTRAWEFCAGAGVALATGSLGRMPRSVAEVLSWGGFVGIVVAALAYNAGTAFPGSAALLPVLATAAVIAAGCHASAGLSSGAERILGRRPAQWLGGLSYQWYLWHWPLVVLVPDAIGHPLRWPALTAVSIGALGVSVIVHYAVERPIRKLRRRPAVAAGGALATATVAAVAVLALSLPNLAIGARHRVIHPTASYARLQVLLRKGLEVRSVPKNLAPILSDAVNDEPISTTDGSNCYAEPLVIAQSSCVYGDPHGSKTIALVGDSHAQQWLPALDEYAKKHDLKIVSWTKSACSLADLEEYNTTLHREYKECDAWRKITIARTVKLHASLTVVSQSNNVPDPKYSSAQWAEATVKMMDTFKDAGMKTVYILDTPLAKSVVPDCVAAHLHSVEDCVQKNTRSKYQFPGREASIASALRKAHIPSVQPVHWLCTPTACPVIVDDILVYRDLTHLTATYSRFLTPLVATAVLRAGGLSVPAG